MAADRPAITGNRLVLAGAVLYLLEWVAIIPAGDSGPSDPGLSSDKVLGLYTAHPTAVAFLATWISVVLIGRVLIVLGIRAALRSVGADDTIILFAAAAMTVSVVLEVVSESAVAAAGLLASRSADPALVRAFDTLAGVSWAMVFGPLGLAVALSAWTMLRSRAFPFWMCIIGLAGGGLMLLSGVFAGPGYLHAGAARSISTFGQVGAPLFWIWMLATGIFLLRRTPGRTAAAT
jgi:hypothetical protein